jgi:hypothetical protein
MSKQENIRQTVADPVPQTKKIRGWFEGVVETEIELRKQVTSLLFHSIEVV